MKTPGNKHTPVLSDHKRAGKKLIPPFLHLLPRLHEISWIRQELPEVLWITLIHRYFGDHRAVELLTQLTRSVRTYAPQASSPVFGTATAYEQLSAHQADQIRSELETAGILQDLRESLRPLLALYPECPLNRLFVGIEPSTSDTALHELASTVAPLLDKHSREATMAQATLTWLGFDARILKVSEGMALAEFPHIEEYPETDLSKRIASSIGASLFLFFIEPHYPGSPTWPAYFWNRGLAISPCKVS